MAEGAGRLAVLRFIRHGQDMKRTTINVPRSWFFVLFTLSGFAGLIYESIWSHYLKLFLGHAAYAQTLVLAIFMGGMALGSWICGRYSGRWRRLLLGYAAVEAVIGVLALVFHPAFVALTDYAYDTVMPGLGSPVAVSAFKWGLGALFILPQSVLLGMTFPLMTAGVIRAYPEGSGGSIAMLYFTNSLGAAAGVLASGFLLIALVGLPGTILTAGLINLLLATIVWLLAKSMPPALGASQASAAVSPKNVPGYRLMLAVALLTGAASFMYEIGWIRMLSLVLGSSTHAFELMLSAFILGLAFGSRWIKGRIERGAAAPERVLGVVQVAMGILALATLLVYGRSFELMQVLLDTVARSERGYAAFNFGSHLIAMLIMFPAAFCAGMTLPLITHALLQRGAGERAIGSVYAANMVGSIAGVFLAVHFGMPALGLKGLISLGAAIDLALGLVLLWWIAKGAMITRFATVGGAAALAATLAWVELDSLKMASGVYRHGILFDRAEMKVLYHRDGKTATVNLTKVHDRVSITTNGKPDAAINLDPHGEVAIDEPTMILAGALPLAIHPQARSAANIGFGSGLTSHVMLASGALRELDTIEIEPAMVEAARGFSPRNNRVYEDPRSRIYIEDAKSFFSVHNKRYDIIVSEPSNPWVSGVAGLFTEEFYRRVKRHLNSDGVFVQWVQLYEINPTLVASVFKALARQFSDYEVYSPNDTDIIIVARDGRPLPRPSAAAFSEPALAKELERIRIQAAADFDLHRLGGRAQLQPYFEQFRIAPNSEYFPVLETSAARARFMKENALAVSQLAMLPIPALELLGDSPRRTVEQVPPRPWLSRSEKTRSAMEAKRYLLRGQAEALASVPAALRSDFELVRLLLADCPVPRRGITVDQLSAVMGVMLPFLAPDEIAPLFAQIGDSPCGKLLAEPERKWLALYRALAARRADEAGQLAAALLHTDHPAAAARTDYLLGVAVAGSLAEGDVQRAQALWREFGRQAVRERQDQLPDFLRAHLASRL
jgi:predicted membrane-bound spermidine synthase